MEAIILHEKKICEKEKYIKEKKWLNSFLTYVRVEKLTREMVLGLIDSIVVNRDGEIEIRYRFKEKSLL